MDTIGEQLKNARTQRGLSIEDLQKTTKIQKHYLSAIEENDFTAIPSDYYTRTFIRQYAEAVGINPRPLINQFEGKTESNDGDAYTSSATVNGSRKEKFKQKNAQQSKINHYLPLTLLIIAVMAIVGTIVYAIHLDTTNGPIVPKPEKTTIISESSSTEESTKESSTSKEKETESSSSEKPKKKDMDVKLLSDSYDYVSYQISEVNSPITLELSAQNGPAWVGIQQSGTGELYYQQTIQLGEPVESIVPEGIQSVDVIVGAASNLVLKVNNQIIDFNQGNPSIGTKSITLNFDAATTDSSESITE